MQIAMCVARGLRRPGVRRNPLKPAQTASASSLGRLGESRCEPDSLLRWNDNRVYRLSFLGLPTTIRKPILLGRMRLKDLVGNRTVTPPECCA